MNDVQRIYDTNNLDDSVERYKVILTHTPQWIAGDVTGREPGIYKFNIPPLGSNTNSTEYNQCFIVTKKIIVDPVSIDAAGRRNPDVKWVNLSDPFAGDDFSMGSLIADFNLPSQQQGLIQEATGATSFTQEQLYRHQELCSFEMKYKQNYQGLNLFSQQEVTAPSMETADIDLGERQFMDRTGAGMPVTPAFELTGGTDIEIKNLWTKQTIVGSMTNTMVVGAEGNTTYGLTGATTYYCYEPKNPCMSLCGNPFGTELTLRFKDCLTGSGPVILEGSVVARDISVVCLELEVIMVKNRPAVTRAGGR